MLERKRYTDGKTRRQNNMSDTKKEFYSNVQKSIFSMKLKKIRDQWKEETGRTYEEMYAEVLDILSLVWNEHFLEIQVIVQ